MNKGIVPITAVIIGVIILGGGIGGYVYLKNKQVKPIACTADAKQCSDGSYVSRIPPKCEFAECPVVTSSCAKEGESPTYFNLTTGKINPEGQQCCSGLKEIGFKTNQATLKKGLCTTTSGVPGICASCGNGICESAYEDRCNCKEDCK